MDKTYNKGAIGLLVVMGVGFLALTGVLVMSEGVLSGLITEQNTTATIRAFYASESVMQEGVGRHLEEVSKGTASSFAYTLTSNLSFTNGATAKEITVTPEPGTYRFTVKGEAGSNKALRKIVKTLTSYPAGESFNHALYSAGSLGLTLAGSSKVNGDVYSHGPLEIQNAPGNSYTVDGDVFSFSNDINPFGSNSIDGNIVEDYGPVYPPAIEASLYKEIASSTGSYFTSDTEAKTCINNGGCDNKVVYIDTSSDVNININNSTFVGAIITPANLTIKGKFYAISDYPVIVTDGKLTTGGGTIIKGMVVVGGEGESLMPNNTEIFGALIFTDEDAEVTNTGGLTITYNSSYFANITDFVGLGFEPDNIDSIMLLDWHEE
jgi:hypothetical protein